MKKAPKVIINVFGEESVANVYEVPLKKGGFTYACIRDNDCFLLAYGKELKGYLGDIIRTMYTGERIGEGDYILESDRHGMICKFK